MVKFIDDDSSLFSGRIELLRIGLSDRCPVIALSGLTPVYTLGDIVTEPGGYAD